MTKEQLAERLNGRQYGREITREEEKLAKESGLVVIFGASDDLCEMRGVIDDEFGCYDGGEIDCEDYPGELQAIWCPASGGSWGYETDLPHADFNIYEDDMLYCVGIVVDLKEGVATMHKEPRELAAKIMKHYGAEAQKDILIEECAELIQAVEKTRRCESKPKFTADMIEEMADVQIMIWQFESLMNGFWRECYEHEILRKLRRQTDRINEEDDDDP